MINSQLNSEWYYYSFNSAFLSNGTFTVQLFNIKMDNQQIYFYDVWSINYQVTSFIYRART